HSTPAWRSSMAALCLRLCGETRFCFREGIRSPAIATYLPMRYWTASTPTRLPQPLLQRDDGRGGQRRAPFLASLAQATDMCAARQGDGVPVEADQLG